MGIAVVTFVAADGCGVGHAVVRGIGNHGAAVAGAEEDRDNTSGGETGNIAQDIFRTVILIMAGGVVHGIKILIAYWHLPHHHAAMRILAEQANVAEVA